MNIHIEVNKYAEKSIQIWGITAHIYAKTDSQAKEIAKKIIDQIPEEQKQEAK